VANQLSDLRDAERPADLVAELALEARDPTQILQPDESHLF
jgi:hypothetical protein